MSRTLFPEWRKQNDPTSYPFSERATLVNGTGRVITEGTFLDAALYPIGAGVGLYMESVKIDFQNVVLSLATPGQPGVATGEFTLVDPPDQVVFYDPYGRPAGVLVSEGRRLGIFQTWGVGLHEFLPAESEFAASCVFPTPEVGVRGIRLETGELFVGDVCLVGGDGVVLSTSETEIPVPGTSRTRAVTQIRVDVVGDPLFRRRLCQPRDLFSTPRFVKTIRVVGPNMEFDAIPDAAGNVRLTTINDLAADTVLRIGPHEGGIEIGAAGAAMAAGVSGTGGFIAFPGGGLTGTFPSQNGAPHKFLQQVTTVRGGLAGYSADTIKPADLGTGTPNSTKILYGDGRWDVPSGSVSAVIGYSAENKDTVTLEAGAPVAVHSSGTGVRRADAQTTGYDCVGLVFESTAVGLSAAVRIGGTLTLADWTLVTGTVTLTSGATYFLSATSGQLTTAPPVTLGQRVQQVGVAVSPDTLAIQILQPILL